jgi:hypothetical protein
VTYLSAQLRPCSLRASSTVFRWASYGVMMRKERPSSSNLEAILRITVHSSRFCNGVSLCHVREGKGEHTIKLVPRWMALPLATSTKKHAGWVTGWRGLEFSWSLYIAWEMKSPSWGGMRSGARYEKKTSRKQGHSHWMLRSRAVGRR